MGRQTGRNRATLQRVYLAANVPLIAAIFLLPHLYTFTWGLLGFGATAAVIVGVVRHRPANRRAWILLALALAAFISGDTIYSVLTTYLHQKNPFPSVADVFYLATYPLFAAGLLSMVRARRREPDAGALLDALTVTTAALVLSWIYLIQPYVHAQGMSVGQKLVSMAYPLGDLLILSVLARLLAGGRLRNAAVAFLGAGAIGLLAADVAYGWIQLNGTWKVGGPTDLGWVAFYILWGAAALHPSMRELTEKQPRRYRKLNVSTLLVLSAVTLVAPGLLAWRALVSGNANDAGIIALASAVLFVLVLGRLTGLARSQAVHARREHALRTFGERLVATTELGEVYAASLEAVRAMVGTGALTCLVTEAGPSGERVVASDPPGSEGTAVDVEDPDPARWTSIPLSANDGTRRRLLLAHVGLLPLDAIAILDAVAAQMVLAVERVELARVLHERRSEARFRSLVQHASDVILVLQPDGRLRAETPSVQEILGYPPEAVAGMSIADLVHPDDAGAARSMIDSLLAGTRSATVRTQWRIRHAAGRWVPMEVLGNDLSGDTHVGGVVLTLRDVTERTRLEGELRHRAFHDSLTNLANRALLHERVENALSRQGRQGGSVMVLVLDLDDFKLVNDTLGHDAGDELLVQVGARLLGCVRQGDTAARLGGDEFAVCTEAETSKEDATPLVHRIMDAMREPFVVAGTEVFVKASIGVSVSTSQTRTALDMLREADLAMYAAKNAGKATFRFFEPGIQQVVLARLEQRAALERAITDGQLCLVYQPIVALEDGRMVATEALVRWRHPDRGLVSPAEFIPVAEESGLIVPLGRWVLDQACADLARWQARAPEAAGLRISVNVSARQLSRPGFLDSVDQALRTHGLSPSSLTVEITESALVQDDDEILASLQALHSRGIALALDDFGTGYSSLSYLHRFPIDCLKIDRSFVVGMDGEDGLTLVDAIASIGRTMGLNLVAEGIEREDQASQLKLLGCQYGQGYLFGKPMPAEAFEGLLQSHASVPQPAA